MVKTGVTNFYFKSFGSISALNLPPECIRKRIKDNNFGHMLSGNCQAVKICIVVDALKTGIHYSKYGRADNYQTTWQQNQNCRLLFFKCFPQVFVVKPFELFEGYVLLSYTMSGIRWVWSAGQCDFWKIRTMLMPVCYNITNKIIYHLFICTKLWQDPKPEFLNLGVVRPCERGRGGIVINECFAF